MRITAVVCLMAVSAIVTAGFAPSDTRVDVFRGRTAEQWFAQSVKQRRRGDDLQRRLTVRVREVRRLEKAQRAKLAAVGGHPLERDFLCIYSHENGGYGWTANTGNGYYGGLQMDREFQSTYGPEFVRAWGTADHWPQSVQIAVSMRAYLSGRGFGPWPNTSRMCGLR